MNYFGPGIDAARYARARPRIHAEAISTFRRLAGASTVVPRGLDVGCGTGESTIALTDVADQVVGVDASSDMLGQAPSHRQVDYVRAAAEQLPFCDRSFDLMTAALSFHWFDAEPFLAEASRLLRPSGWLAIYTSGFTGQMVEDAGFAGWFRDVFLGQFPTPTRNRGVITPALAATHRLILQGEEEFVSDVAMTADQFVDYELSTTNIIAAAERRGVTLDEAAVWLRAAVRPFFRDRSRGTFRFAGTLWCSRKT